MIVAVPAVVMAFAQPPVGRGYRPYMAVGEDIAEIDY